MTCNRNRILTLSAAFAICAALLSPSASASTLNFNLLSPAVFTGLPSVVSFTATVSAPLTNTGPVFLNSDSATVDFPLTVDDTPFFLNFPLSLAPGASFTGLLFTVTVPNFAQPNVTYHGFFEIDGGADAIASDPLASATFTVTPVPEPATGLSLIGCLLFALRRRSASRATSLAAPKLEPVSQVPSRPSGQPAPARVRGI